MESPSSFNHFVNVFKMIPSIEDWVEGDLDVPHSERQMNELNEDGVGEEMQQLSCTLREAYRALAIKFS